VPNAGNVDRKMKPCPTSSSMTNVEWALNEDLQLGMVRANRYQEKL
jgi:hypothetical protein